jgi:hypothetical protein
LKGQLSFRRKSVSGVKLSRVDQVSDLVHYFLIGPTCGKLLKERILDWH